MLEKLRQHLTYANVTATLALFIALGGSSYAALRIGSREIVDNSVRSRDVRNHSLTRRDLARNTLDGTVIRESTLGRVHSAASAANADHVGGMTANDLRLRCPLDTFPAADVCVEKQARPPAAYTAAALTCSSVDFPTGLGRRLPTHSELLVALTGTDLAPGGELTSEVYRSSANPSRLDALFITSEATGDIDLTPDTAAGAKAYRCVRDPSN